MKFAEKFSAVCMLAIGVVAAFSLGSCNKEPNEEPVTVVFPEAQTLNVEANTTETLNFSINADWILYSDSEWATFNDGELSCSGGAGDVTVKLEISDLGQTLEETSVAHLTLAAGAEEHVIYTINRAPEGTEFTVTDADGNEVTALTAGWEDYDYYTISANFVFAVSDENKPEWLETESAVTNSESDPCTAGFKVVDDAAYYKYAQSDKIVFANEAGTISFEYPITFAGMDADAIEIDGAGQYGWIVNADGTDVTYAGTETDPTFTISVLSDDYVIAIADYTWPDDWAYYVDPTYDESETYDDESAAWIHVSSDDGQGTVTLSFDATTSARNAYALAFPRAVYDELNEAHNGHGLNWLPDDEGNLDDEYEQYVIARIEQTTSTGEESFSAYDSNSMASIDVETEAPEGYDFSAVLADYSGAHVGYIPWEVGTNMMVAILPLLSGDEEANLWAMDPAAYDANGDSCYGQDYYTIEGTGGFFYAGSSSYCGVLVSLDSTPQVDWFYLVFNNPDDSESDTWVLFFYGEGTGAGTPSSIFAINGTTYEDLGVIETTYTGEIYDDFISGIKSNYNVAGEAYIHYEVDKDYTVGVANATSSDDWALEPTALDYYGNYVYEQSSVYDFEAGQTVYYNGAMRPATNLSLYSDPGCIFYFVWTDGDSSYILFFYNDELPSDNDELGDFMLTQGSGTVLTSVNDYTGKYDLQAIVDHYDAQKVGILNASVGSTYYVAFSGLYNNKLAPSWVCDNVNAYNYEGVEYEQNDDRPSGTTPYFAPSTLGRVAFAFASDPGTVAYLVFTDDDGTNYVFFFIYSEPSSDPGEPVFPGEDNGGETVSYGLAVQDITGGGNTEVEVYDTCPVELTHTSGCYTVQEVVDDLEPDVVGYVPYKAGTTYATTVTPLDASATWISSLFLAYNSWYDTSLNWDDESDGTTFDAGTSYVSDGTSYPSVDISCYSFPDKVDYIFVAYRTKSNFGSFVALLVLYPTDEDDSGNSGEGDETTWSAVPTDAATEWGESVWEGLYEVYGSTDAWKPTGTPELYSDNMLGFYNGDSGSGYKFGTSSSTYRIQLAGGGSTTKCNLQFKVTGNGSISVSVGSSKSGDSRTLLIYAGDTEITSEADEFSESTATTFTHSVTGISGETVISICSKSSGINVFDIKWVPEGVSDGDDSGNSGDDTGNDDDDAAFYICNSLTLEQYTCASSYDGQYSSFVSYFFSSNGDFDHVGYLVCDWDWTKNDEYNYLVAPAPLNSSNEFGWEGSLVWDDGTTTWFDDYAEVEGGQSLTLNGVSYPATLLTVTGDPSEVFGLVFNNNGEKWALLIISTK